MSDDYKIFKGKTLSNLFEDIYTNQLQKKVKINSFIDECRLKIKTKDDLSVFLPIINDMMKESVRNDEHLIKLAQIVQKITAINKKTEDVDGILTDEEKRQLLEGLDELRVNTEVERFETEVSSIKKKFDIE